MVETRFAGPRRRYAAACTKEPDVLLSLMRRHCIYINTLRMLKAMSFFSGTGLGLGSRAKALWYGRTKVQLLEAAIDRIKVSATQLSNTD